MTSEKLQILSIRVLRLREIGKTPLSFKGVKVNFCGVKFVCDE